MPSPFGAEIGVKMLFYTKGHTSMLTSHVTPTIISIGGIVNVQMG